MGDPFAQPSQPGGDLVIHHIMPAQERVLGGSPEEEIGVKPFPLLGGGGAPEPWRESGAPPPIGHNMPRPEAALPAAPIRTAPSPISGAQQPITAHQTPIEQPPAPIPEAAATKPAKPAKPPPFIKQEDPFTYPIGEHPLEEALTVNSIMHPDTPAEPPRSRGIEDIAQDLHERSQQALKDMGIKSGRITGPDNGHQDEMLARSLASEAKRALEAPGANAGNWYTGKVEEAMHHAGLMYPEITTDPGAKAAFQAALAITSQGETVPSNVRLATQAYDYFRQYGNFPVAITAKEGPSMGRNFAKFNKLVEIMGLDGAREFLDAPTTPRKLTEQGFKVGTSENLDTPVYGSHIFGAKIGNGFYQNLGGNYNPVTFDLWWMRGWNRKTGNLVGYPDISEQRTRFEDALKNPLESQNPDQQALYAGKNVPRTLPRLDQIAEDIRLAHERDFRDFRQEYNEKTRTKSELTNAAARYQAARFGINEAPKGGGQRQWMRDVTYRARDLLEQEGHKLTPADLQAILWYPEKDLYGKLGGRPSEDINIDYAQALMQEARRRGHIGESPLLPALGRSGPTPALHVGRGNPPGGLEGGGGYGGAPAAGGIGFDPADGDPFAGIP